MAARTARQRRSSSAVEIGVFRRSDKAMVSVSPGRGLAHDVNHGLEVAGKKLRHVAGDRRHGAVLVALRVAAKMRKNCHVFYPPQRTAGRQRFLRKDVERSA